jgi:anthranilate synthase/aminodeoxychorismate synthase-like glutamine amidotransferase
MNILLVDNRDSFTHNLAEAFRVAGARVTVVRNSIAPEMALARAKDSCGALLLSPGPGAPKDAGCCLELIRIAHGNIPLIGVCLGHQAIVEARGGIVIRAAAPCHGKVSHLEHRGMGPFSGLISPMAIGRYHSLCTPITGLPAGLECDAQLEGMAMAIRDDRAGQIGFQFHPESILTTQGDRLVSALIGWAAGWRARSHA